MEKSTELETALQKQFKQLETDFRKLLFEKNLKVVLRSGAWINNNGIGIGWLSCSSGDPQKESLELTVDFKFNKKNTLLNYDIYWSDGSCVEELDNFEVSSNDDVVKLIGEIKECIDKIREVGLSHYLVHVIENLEKL